MKNEITKINNWLFEIPKSFRPDMLVPARIFASEKLLADIRHDHSLEQLINTATLPGIQKYALAMPDAHEGYGFPIGGVVATSYPDGFISPGGIGYDINCGVRLLMSSLTVEELKPQLEALANLLYQNIPSGVGKGGRLRLSLKDLDKVLERGCQWAIDNGYGTKEDLAKIESGGSLPEAAVDCVSNHAKERGQDQLGTLGAGNHFIEVDRVAEIFDAKTAGAFGLFGDQAVVLIHTGSRGLGHQVATDHIKTLLQAMAREGIKLPDLELAGMPFSSPEGRAYFSAMSAAANFAWANRQLITHGVRTTFEKVLGPKNGRLDLLYDVAHNIAKIEEHMINGKKKKVIVHRKGATRSFAGQPVIIPGSMGSASYVLVGTAESRELSFGSTCHGAGRRLSRHAALKQVSGQALREDLGKQGILVRAGSSKGLAEEAPQAYKNVDEVVEVVHQAHLARKVGRLKPVLVIKG